MRDVLPELMEWWRAGETVGVGTVVATFQSAPAPARRLDAGRARTGPAVGSVSGGCVEGAVYELGQSVVDVGRAGAAALRRLRRRRVRRRPHLRRHPRRVRREGQPRDLPRARGDRRRHRGRPPGRAGHRDRAPRPGLAGPAVVRACTRDERRPTGSLGLAARPTTRSTTTRWACWPAAQRHADLRPRRRTSRRGDAGLRVGVRARSRGCWSSARSTSRPRSPGSAASSATT